jgi:hypothetical protein
MVKSESKLLYQPIYRCPITCKSTTRSCDAYIHHSQSLDTCQEQGPNQLARCTKRDNNNSSADGKEKIYLQSVEVHS